MRPSDRRSRTALSPFYNVFEEVYNALEESVKLQSHYAKLLNHYDDGERMYFSNALEWIYRLRELDRKNEENE